MDDDAGCLTDCLRGRRLDRIPEIDFHPGGASDGKVWSGFTRNVEIFFDGCYVVRRPPPPPSAP